MPLAGSVNSLAPSPNSLPGSKPDSASAVNLKTRLVCLVAQARRRLGSGRAVCRCRNDPSGRHDYSGAPNSASGATASQLCRRAFRPAGQGRVAGQFAAAWTHGRHQAIATRHPSRRSTSRTLGLPKNGSAPIAVGILPKTSTGSFMLPATSEVLFAEVGQLGVTYEPVGELPKSPSQPWAFIGHCGKFWM